VQKSVGKILASNLWDQDGTPPPPIDYLPKGQTINAENYSSLMVQFKEKKKKKLRWKFTKGVLFLHDNSPVHRAIAILPGLPVSCSHTLFSGSGPVALTPVPWTEKNLKVRHFSSDAVIAAAET
jgi:hypothetical protein